MTKKEKPDQGQDQKPTFEKSRFIAQAKLIFNQPPEVVAGALRTVTENITIDQAREKVKAFLSRPIHTEGGK